MRRIWNVFSVPLLLFPDINNYRFAALHFRDRIFR